ncbi:sulfate ABC transporter permease subunit CysT [Agrobacterium vitis]|uniref:Sulfate transport system permease protein CysT n=1 Tax=Agrobacterium vitis TaxID=373 RepID=A0AAE5AUM4_AGRVI|nr:sulfate ABC transporter permease subunit CysT [Agrobacterium vitis]MCF1497323.1 sulfate ABC transporter permease subunit CysT [Allorhizobium sp. Av2]MCM2438983.1 sulfate ABC transporter permease subunit CysT [Agrobacterium vitis]MUZ56739.1 sulfate ABC transporter permease subunit CysT [Agrobacterium vitis]MVA65109.1 sulfate ABC transporter permease subunit CysT [Agrobacterium vitis]MVA86124.1 sulfate ABC transporter permease subunit CysT [Agrobacterium vitis]
MAHSPVQGRWQFRQPSVLPGFGLTFGFTVFYLALIVLIPLSGLVWRSAELGWTDFWHIASDRRTLGALKVSFGSAILAAILNVVFGVLVAWVLVRYNFWGRRIIDAMVDLPFALPTAVAGIALASLYAPNGWVGSLLAPLGLKVAYTQAGIVVAMVFIGLPFVVRTVQPVMEEIDRDVEEAAATLGASRFATIFKVLLPGLAPAIMTGFALALARGVGEYGSVIFVAGNVPYVSEIAPLLIVIRLEEFNYAGATAVGAVMLAISFAMLLLINLIQAASRRKYGND